MKYKLYSRTLSLLLAFALCIGMLPGVALAQGADPGISPDISSEVSEEIIFPGDEETELQEVTAINGWHMQQFGLVGDVAILEGGLTVAPDGDGFILNHKICTDGGLGSSLLVYNDKAPKLAASVLEFDLNCVEADGRYRIAVFPRYQAGDDCGGIAIDAPNAFQAAGQSEGEYWTPTLGNSTDFSFVSGQDYHIKVVTGTDAMELYVDGSLITTRTLDRMPTSGGYAFRIWGIDFGNVEKIVSVQNLEFTELPISSLGETTKMIAQADWGESDVVIPVTFGKNDTVASVVNGGDELTADIYSVGAQGITIKADYFKTQSDSFKLTVNFAGGSSGEITLIRLVASAEEPELLHHYTFDERSGDSYADSSESADAANGAKNGTIGSVNGRNGKALMLGGTGCVQIESAALQNLTSYSVSAWINWDGTLSASNTIFSGHEDWFHVRKQDGNDKKLWLGYFQGGDKWSDVGQNSKQVTPNEWVHVAYVKNGATVSLYLNGELQGSANDVTTPVGKSNVFYIGGDGANGGAHPFRGMIDEVKVFSTPLTQGDIAAIIALPADIISTLPKTETIIKTDDWGKTDVSIPVTFGADDSVKCIMNGSDTLEIPNDYTTDENGITLKMAYIGEQKDSFALNILFEKGSDATFAVNQLDTTIQEHIWTKADGIADWEKLPGAGTFAMEEGGLRVKGEVALVNTASPACLDGEVEITYEQLNDDGNAGVLFRANTEENTWQGVWQDTGYMQRFYFKNSAGIQGNVHGDCSFAFSRKGYADHKMKIRLQDGTVTVWLDDQFVSSTEVKAASSALGKLGLYTGGPCDILLKKAVFRNVLPFAPEVDSSEDLAIAKSGMTVRLADNFPRVKDYTLNNKTLSGAEFKYDYVTINTVDYPATATVKTTTADSVTYTVNPTGCDVSFDVVFAVLDGHVLEMRINNIDETAVKVYSIGFPNQPLISADSTQTGAKLDATVFQENMFTGNNQWDQTTLAERHYVVAENKMSKTVSESATIAVVTNDGLSASMANNVLYNIHEFQIKAFDLPGGNVSAGVYNTEFAHRGLDGEKMFPIASEPEENDLYCRIVVTEDTNDDGLMDWQDGANALKTIVSNKIPGGDKAARSFFQVGYNFVSEAQQPFLKVEDNLKRMSNLIDGFDQILVLKGYANEGHDSAHADYDDISKRAGGADDLNAMTDAIKEINATFGIHINNTEAYPEAKMFNEENMTDHNAWKWMDQSKELRREVYILNNGMDTRLNNLFTKTPDIGFVYVDTYGDDRWCSARLADNLIGNGAMMGTENKNDLDRYVSWVHWPDIAANSMHSFLYHIQKDVYNGSGTDLMWGGYGRSASFMSWQHNTNITPVLEQFYTNQLPQKYLMCHDVRKMTGSEAIFEGGVRSTSDRKIYKDDHLIADGAGMIFIPWFAEDSVTRNPDEAAKIYHWNAAGGETTWYLPESWNVQNVYLYENTQTGKKLVETIEVKDGQVTIDAKAKTPYMVYPGEAAADVTAWSVGSPIEDTGFNSRDFSIWQKTGEADIQFNDNGDGVSILTMEGAEAGSLSQTMTGLVPGQKYRALVWAGAENGKTARITVETPDGKTYTNYVDQIVRGNNCFDTYARNMRVERVWVDFIQPEGETTATFTLSADTCEAENGKATFMETRIVKTADPGLPTDDTTRNYAAYETFEYIEQGGTGIFTPEGGGDGGYHLSETHLPYTTDTISANGSQWSLKMYGYGRANMRTYPAAMRLESNTNYTMEFDTLGGGTVYIVSEADGSDMPLKQSFAEGHSKFTFTTGGKKDYIARIEGCNVLDNFQVYSVKDLTPPTAPRNLRATVEDNARVILTWAAAADPDSAVGGYKIYRDGKLLATLGNVLTYTDEAVSEYTGYTYQVSAVNGGSTEGERSSQAKAYVGTDFISPTVEKVVLNSLTTATLTFSEGLDQESTEVVSNYQVTGSAATVTAAALSFDGRTVVLTLSGLSATDTAILRVVGVKDASVAGNATTGNQNLTLSALAHYFKFDETEGSKASDFTGREDAVKASTVVTMDGVNDKAAKFNEDGYVELSGQALYRQNEFTLSTWINLGRGAKESATIFSNGASGDGNSYGIWLHMRGDKLFASYKNNDGGYTDLSSNTVGAPYDEWVHVAFVKRANGADLYLDGQKVGTNSVAVNMGDHNGKMRIGGNYNTANALLHKFKGGIDEFKIYTAPLTEAQVAAIAGVSSYPPTVIGTTFGVTLPNPKALEVTVDFNGTTLTSIKEGEVALTEGAYTATATAVTFRTDYLKGLSVGTHTLKLSFSDNTQIAVTLEVGSFTATVDRTPLMEAIYTAEGLVEADFDPVDWAALQVELTEAKAAAQKPDLTEREMTEATAKLQAAIDKLLIPVTGVTLDPTSATLYSNTTSNTLQLTATVAPADAANPRLFWESSDEAVATVNENGLVAAVGNGETTITVTTVNGSYTATCKVTVTSYNPPSGGGGATTKPPVVTENPDGSTTKTVTDKKTGNVTETTTYPDGTKIVATTPKDEKTSIEVTIPKDKEKVTITIPTDEQPKSGEVAVIIHEDGTREVVKTSVSTADGLRVTLTGSAKLEIVDNSKSFADVPTTHWGADAIAFVTSRELFNGGDGGFQPAGDMSRAMLFTVLARLDGQDLTGGEAWYAKAMDWARETGVSDGTNPEASITRESLAVMLYCYAGSPEVGGMTLSEFTDAERISDWASDAMLWCVDSGILNGSGAKLNPAATASRVEVAAMLQRFVEAEI